MGWPYKFNAVLCRAWSSRHGPFVPHLSVRYLRHWWGIIAASVLCWTPWGPWMQGKKATMIREAFSKHNPIRQEQEVHRSVTGSAANWTRQAIQAGQHPRPPEAGDGLEADAAAGTRTGDGLGPVDGAGAGAAARVQLAKEMSFCGLLSIHRHRELPRNDLIYVDMVDLAPLHIWLALLWYGESVDVYHEIRQTTKNSMRKESIHFDGFLLHTCWFLHLSFSCFLFWSQLSSSCVFRGFCP